MKVIITVQAGQTGLRRVGTEMDVPKEQAEAWVKLGIVKKKTNPKKKTKDGNKDKKDESKSGNGAPKSK